MKNCRIQDFRLLKEIGKGSFGKIILSTHRKTDQKLAIKYIDLTVDGSDLILVQNEIDIHKQLMHPNIISMYAIIDEAKSCNRMFLILEHMEANDLWHFMNNPVTLLQSINVLKQLTNALIYCHSKYIMHRDVKLENVLFDPAANVAKLIDFGLAGRFKTPLTPKKYIICGTTEYQAYEMVCKEEYDERVDIWALGVLFYELLINESPFNGNTHLEIYKNIKTKKLKPDVLSYSIYSVDLWSILSGLLEKDPDFRLSLRDILVKANLLIEKIEMYPCV